MNETTQMNKFDREALVNELHARPFLSMEDQRHIACLVYLEPLSDAFAGIETICAHFGKAGPSADQRFHMIETDGALIKWERHSELTSLMIYAKASGATEPFGETVFDNLPSGWRDARKDRLLSSILIEIPKYCSDDQDFTESLEEWRHHFSTESFAAAAVLEDAALVASDFRLHNGHVRFLLLPRRSTGNKRIGRLAQRLIEIETYKTASMLSLPIAHETSRELTEYEAKLAEIMNELGDANEDLQELLDEVIALSVQVEGKITETTFRFSAAEAYSAIVTGRVEIIREQRIAGRQLLSEFMMRRYEPSMRTVASTWTRLREFSKRVERAANLLRTRVDVRNAQSQQALLHSMNARAETQLRLQETVEGFSVVAISYYAISLLAYFLAPFAKALHIDKTWLIAASVIPVVLFVRYFVHRIKTHITHKDED